MAVFERREWHRIGGYLDEALDLEPHVRGIWLDELATAQPGVAGILRSLLAELEVLDANGFMEQTPLSSTAFAALHHTSMAGKEAGPYTIDRLLGSGGMGEVWLASRSDGRFEGQCAIKFLSESLVQPRLAERFRHEGRLLARLGHPNIARLLDAGATSDGRQFLVLEYVDGMRIDEYCNVNELSVSARVRLFLDAVAAVAHAHSQLIVHRDLKPSNVLVTRDGTVKLLDFGIAKLLSADQRPTNSTMTRAEEMVLTPEYAAPEQLLGETPSTATDVYQLGMLLYVLLARGHPLQLHANRTDRVKAALTSSVPLASDFAPDALRKQLRGDLDAILNTALNPDPAQRYPTAAALREELLRYLNGEPVSARRGVRFYGAGKFILRHRAAVGASAVALATLCGVMIFALAQARIAASERDHAFQLASRNAAVTEFLGTLITDAAEAEKPVTVTEMLARSEKLALADTGGNPETRAAVLAMIGARYGALDEHTTAARLFENGLALLAHSHDDSLRAELTCLHASSLGSLGQTDAAVRTIEHELEHLQGDPEMAAYCLLYRSFIAANLHDAAPALHYAIEGLDRFQLAPHTSAADEGLFLGAVGWGYHLNGRNREADEYFRRAMQKYADLGREASANALTVRNNWAIVVDVAGSPKQALEIYDHTLTLTERSQGAPSSPFIGNRARALEALGRYQEARAGYESLVSKAEQQHDVMGQALGLFGLASVAQTLHDGTAAAKYLERLTAVITPAFRAGTPPWLARALIQGRLDMDSGRFEAARAQFISALGNPSTSTGIEARLGKSEAELRAGDAAAAQEDAQIALQTVRARQGNLPYSNLTGLSWLTLGRAEQQLGHSTQARRAFENAELQLSNTVDPNHPALLEVRNLLSAGRAQSNNHGL